jgi:hypothetical protein
MAAALEHFSACDARKRERAPLSETYSGRNIGTLRAG